MRNSAVIVRTSRTLLLMASLLALSCVKGKQVVAVDAGSKGVPAALLKNFPGTEGRPGLIQIPAGTFHFGCETQDPMCVDIEKPGKEVKVEAFQMTTTEITVGQYKACMIAGKCAPADYGAGGLCNAKVSGRETHPVNCVDQEMAATFCSWIGGRLPTAEEWEYAAKGGESRIYPWGNDEPTPEQAYHGVSNGTAPVATHSDGATRQGLEDMAGNVWEWTSNRYDAQWSEVRGGSWRNADLRVLRASNRGRRPPDDRADFIGFRCAF